MELAEPWPAGPPSGSAVYDSCTESEPAGSKDSSLRGGGAFLRGRRSREGSLRAGGAFGRPDQRARSLGSLLAEAAAVLRGAAHAGGHSGPHPAPAPAHGAWPGPDVDGVELQRRAWAPAGAHAGPAGRPRADAAGGAGLGWAPASEPRPTPPQPAGAPAADLASPRPPGLASGQAGGRAAGQAGALAQAQGSPAAACLAAGTPSTSLTRSDAPSTAGTSASCVASLASMLSGLASAGSDPPPGSALAGLPGGPAPPHGAWPLALGEEGRPPGIARSPSALLDAHVEPAAVVAEAAAAAAAAAAAGAHWRMVRALRVRMLEGHRTNIWRTSGCSSAASGIACRTPCRRCRVWDLPAMSGLVGIVLGGCGGSGALFGVFWCVTRPCSDMRDLGHSRDAIWHVLQVVAEEDMPRSVFHDFPSAAGPAPAPRWGHATAAVGDRMYVFGGVGASVFDDAFCYDAGGRPCLVSCRALLVLVAHRLCTCGGSVLQRGCAQERARLCKAHRRHFACPRVCAMPRRCRKPCVRPARQRAAAGARRRRPAPAGARRRPQCSARRRPPWATACSSSAGGRAASTCAAPTSWTQVQPMTLNRLDTGAAAILSTLYTGTVHVPPVAIARRQPAVFDIAGSLRRPQLHRPAPGARRAPRRPARGADTMLWRCLKELPNSPAACAGLTLTAVGQVPAPPPERASDAAALLIKCDVHSVCSLARCQRRLYIKMYQQMSGRSEGRV